MILGGHLIPGNLVALCKRCNNKKHDRPPEEFYTPEELDKLKSILEKQGDVFVFTFDWNYWNQDRKGYLISIGVEPNLVHELLNNPDHRYYIPPSTLGIIISISELGELVIKDLNNSDKNEENSCRFIEVKKWVI